MKQRQSNFEIMRVISIIFIISFHYSFRAGYTFSDAISFNKVFTDMLLMFGEVGVHCFILVSGFFLDRSRFKWSKVVMIILQTEFYIFLFRMVWFIEGVEPFNLGFLKSLIFPILRDQYWFISVYVLVYILSPYLKKLVEALSQKELGSLLLIQFLIWSVYPTIWMWISNSGSTEDMPYFNKYIWFILLFLTGAYIKKYGIPILTNMKRAILLFSVTALFLLGYVILMESHKFSFLEGRSAVYFWHPNTVPQLLMAISFFAIFYYMKAPFIKSVNYIAGCTLGIYMLHDGGLQGFFWIDLFKNASFQNSAFLVLHYIGCVAAVLFLGVVVETIRKKIEIPIEKIVNRGMHFLDVK